MHNLELGAFTFKYSTGPRLPNVFNNYLAKRSDIHNYPTRHANDQNLTRNKKCFSDNAVTTSEPILWNSINKSLKLASSLKHFREMYKRELLVNYK